MAAGKKAKSRRLEDMSPEERRLRREKARLETQKRRRTILVVLSAVILLSAAVAAFVMFQGVFEERAEENTLSIQQDGSVVFEELLPLEDGETSAGELKSFVKTQISDYMQGGGTGKVKLQRFALENGKAYVRTHYDSPETYKVFTGYDVALGTAVVIENAGYTLDEPIYAVKDGKLTDQLLSLSDYSSEDEGEIREILAIRENVLVKVNGTIIGATGSGTELIAPDTLRIKAPTRDADVAVQTYILSSHEK